MEILKIDSTICDYYSETKDNEDGSVIVGWCHDNGCECSEIPIEECVDKAVALCKLKDKKLEQLKAENDRLKKAEEYDSRYNDLQAEIDCGERMINQLKAERDSYIDKYFLESQKVLKLSKALKEIKGLAEKISKNYSAYEIQDLAKQILQKISEVKDD